MPTHLFYHICSHLIHHLIQHRTLLPGVLVYGPWTPTSTEPQCHGSPLLNCDLLPINLIISHNPCRPIFIHVLTHSTIVLGRHIEILDLAEALEQIADCEAVNEAGESRSERDECACGNVGFLVEVRSWTMQTCAVRRACGWLCGRLRDCMLRNLGSRLCSRCGHRLLGCYGSGSLLITGTERR